MHRTVPLRFSLVLLCLVLGASVGVARQRPTHFVIMFDNSGSMVGPWHIEAPDGTLEEQPAADPERLASLASLLLHDLLESGDRCDVVVFPGVHLPPGKAGLRTIQFDQETLFRKPISVARRLLEASHVPQRVFVMLTDGTPNDIPSPQDARDAIGEAPPFETVVLALGAHEQIRLMQDQTMGWFGEVVSITEPRRLISAFATLFAKAREAIPYEGEIRPGASVPLTIHRYVSRVYVILTSEDAIGAFGSDLVDGQGESRVGERIVDDNGYARSYHVYKLDHDPRSADEWTLSLPSSAPPGRYFHALIEVYELTPELIEVPEQVKAGESHRLRGRILSQGQHFDDAAFFGSDGFRAVFLAGEEEIAATMEPGGFFSAELIARAPGELPVVFAVRNRWMDLRSDPARVQVESYPPLELRVGPAPLDFGDVVAGETDSACVLLDFSGSQGHRDVPLVFRVLGDWPEATGLSSGSGGAGATLGEGPVRLTFDEAGRAELCLLSTACGGHGPAGVDAVVELRGEAEFYAPGAVRLPVRFRVLPTPWLDCNLWWLLTVGGILLLVVLVTGWVVPRDFAPEDRLWLASSESAMRRATARRLRDLPGGRRGFYRSAQVFISHTGSAVRRRSGFVVGIKATKQGLLVMGAAALEHKGPSRKWEALRNDGAGLFLRRNVVYRVGELYFKIG